MKKFSFVLLLITLSIFTIVLASCDFDDSTTHVHEEGLLPRIESTCATHGKTEGKYCLICDAVLVPQEELPLKPHTYGADLCCTECGFEKFSEGLYYKLNRHGNGYELAGIGTCTDTEIIIPDTYEGLPVTAIYDLRSFENVTSIKIPASVEYLDTHPLNICKSITKIEVDENNKNYKSIDGHLYSKDGEMLIKYAIGKEATSFVIPDSVKWIYDDAFLGCNFLINVTIPDSVKYIGDRAFLDCDSLTSVTIGNSVTSIGTWAFVRCTSLISITIPDSVEFIGGEAFKNCTSLTNVTIGNSVTRIGDGAFENCTSITNAIIGNSVTRIGDNAFSGCTSLTSIAIPDSVEFINESAFYNCTSLTSAIIGNSVAWIGKYAFQNCASLKSVIIPDSVTSIGYDAFAYCTSLESVIIPSSVTSIGNNAFGSCYSLTIYCAAESQPDGWAPYWKHDDCPVVWGYKDE